MNTDIFDNKMPLVSVIVPSYCHEKYVDALLNSLINQTYPNIELVIIDDCSKDSTYQLLLNREMELKERFSRVVISQNDQNLGVVRTINKLISLTKGKYIKTIASDDIILKDGIKKLVEFFEQHQEYDLIFSNGLFIDENDGYPLTKQKEYKRCYTEIPRIEDDLFQKLLGQNMIIAASVLIKRSTYEKFGLHDENFYSEDWEFWVRVAEKGKIGYCNKNTIGYRISANSLCHFPKTKDGINKFRKTFQNEFLVIKKYSKSDAITNNSYMGVFLTRNLHQAIDIDDRKTINSIIGFSKKRKIRLDNTVGLKLLFYRLKLLRLVQKTKRLFGFSTGIDYMENI